jgi:hypothetical protein
MKKGDTVYLKDPFWHNNSNLGGKKALVLSTKSYILVKVYDYHSNPVKCFKNEVTTKPIRLEKPDSKDPEPPNKNGYKLLQNYLDEQQDADDPWDTWTD